MPAHLRLRKGKYYLVDGAIKRSLHTTVKRYAEFQLTQYVRRRLGFGPGISVAEQYEHWIGTKREPLVRRATLRDYRQHFTAYILPVLGMRRLAELNVADLERLRDGMIAAGKSVKTAKNVIGATFRAFWKDALRAGLVEHRPFEMLDWPARVRPMPTPFSATERDAILRAVLVWQPFYYPLVAWQFATGCRPSESAGLCWSDIDVERGRVAIARSRHLGAEAAPKTSASRRIISVSRELVELLLTLRMAWMSDEDKVFVNKVSAAPLDVNQWARVYWRELCKRAEVAPRKFYATRHTSITEAIRAGANPMAVAQYHGTSLAMIQADYCGLIELDRNGSKTDQWSANYAERVVVPTGLEPGRAACEEIKVVAFQALSNSASRRKVG